MKGIKNKTKMLTSEKLYLLCQKKLNTNINNQVSIDRSTFVLYFNSRQNNYYDDLILTGRSTDTIQRIQKFLIPVNLTLNTSVSIPNTNSFSLPNDFVKREDIIVKGYKGECYPQVLDVFEIKPAEISSYYNNETTKPSFEFRETFYYVGNNCINIFTDGNFNISDVTLIYYRRPIDIDLQGYINENNEPSMTINPEMDDEDLNKILDLTVQDIIQGNLPVRDVTQ